MTTLVERLEAATGPSRELDLLISRIGFKHQLLKWELAYLDTDGDDLPDGMYVWTTEREKPYTVSVDRYTSSIDAALTLAPGEHWEWECSLGGGIATAKLGDPLLHMEGEAATVPLALCIAALKARGVK